MNELVTPTGRRIDNSCPYEGYCWADQACLGECPPTMLTTLIATAKLEHELEMAPHTDPDVEWACLECRGSRFLGDT